MRNLALADAMAKADDAVRSGRSLSDALAKMKSVPPLAANLLQVGEVAGEPAPMLLRIAALCERDVQNNTERLLRFLPALLIVLMGGMVAAIVSMLLGAVLDVNQVAL